MKIYLKPNVKGYLKEFFFFMNKSLLNIKKKKLFYFIETNKKRFFRWKNKIKYFRQLNKITKLTFEKNKIKNNEPSVGFEPTTLRLKRARS
jgi:hypothetical protein